MAVFQPPDWRIQKDKVPGQADGSPNTRMIPRRMVGLWVPIVLFCLVGWWVDQYFSPVAEYPKGTYQLGSGSDGSCFSRCSGKFMRLVIFPILSPGHNERNTFPLKLAIFQQGPDWRIIKFRTPGWWIYLYPDGG